MIWYQAARRSPLYPRGFYPNDEAVCCGCLPEMSRLLATSKDFDSPLATKLPRTLASGLHLVLFHS